MMDESDKIFFEYTTTPHWPDACGHGGYLFSFTNREVYKETVCVEKLDVYTVEREPKTCWDAQSICMRYGSEPCEYGSFPSIETLIRASHL